jgi:hypothetical protein
MQNNRPVTSIQLFTAEAITKNTAETSVAIDMRALSGNGVFSAHVVSAGAASSLTLTYSLCHTEDGTYVTPSTAVAICTAFAPGSDIFSFEPELAKYMKIIATENNGGAITSLDLIISMQ